MDLQTILSIFLGIGLAASAGFRVFLPLFALSLATYFNIIPLNESWAWVGGFPALIALGIAMIAEIFAYYIPFVDNLLDVIATPLAAIAGTAVMASTLIDLDPMLTWGLAIIAGGGTATAMQGMTSVTRLASSVKTGGLGNPVVSTAETGTAITLSTLSIFVPILALIIVVFIFVIVFWMYRKFRK
ncbi:DUF4126 domain-containing protein [Flavobacterium terrae]|uniref:DUF4126 domain-containing protein n=1 Tax=Flavobacterium terrae TaxID=415425 RepID=A0A1M6EBQ1_9FLAO|nr:DUF4126 domain-containing protein [Flavobacterium terrae]SHI82905.1 protein of unknown function [Flavobacterium terrae]